jgi:ribosomal protein S18 acetylase RimI-like enzyme
MLHAFPMEGTPGQEEAGEDVDPILEPYAKLEIPGSYYISAIAVFPEHRRKGLGKRMLEIARKQARDRGCRQVSLLVFERNEGAVELYKRNGFGIIGRAPDVPHKLIRYTGEVLLMTAIA